MTYTDTTCPNCTHLASVEADGWVMCLRQDANGDPACAQAAIVGRHNHMFIRVADPQQRAANQPHTT